MGEGGLLFLHLCFLSYLVATKIQDLKDKFKLSSSYNFSLIIYEYGKAYTIRYVGEIAATKILAVSIAHYSSSAPDTLVDVVSYMLSVVR